MTRTTRHRSFYILIAALLVSIATSSATAAEGPQLRELRVQQAGTTTYFHAVFDAPQQMALANLNTWNERQPRATRDLSRLPRLVPQDKTARLVYTRLDFADTERPAARFERPLRSPLPVSGLDFVGCCEGKGKVRFLLLYPTEHLAREKQDGEESGRPRREWVETPVELDFDRAEKVAAKELKREPAAPPRRDDLEGLWASAQAAQFAVLEALTPECSFYGYARTGTGRKYGVASPSLGDPGRTGGVRIRDHQQLYETTTGSAAIAESLQTERLLTRDYRDSGHRSIDIDKVTGIDIAQHPWSKMMAGKSPDAEPLANLVPHDNYYLAFKSIRKFIEMGELADQWGTSLIRAYEVHSRDYQLKQRYERQLCLRSTVLGKTLGPLVIHGVAVTGSDSYLREGSDVTVLFHVVNRKLFLAAVETFIQEARQEWRERLKETKENYHDVAVESFVTSLREVSLHRAILGDFVIYSNSAAALRRVIDTHQGRLASLSDSEDFQYMRTVFRSTDKDEDGFAFLSDAFIRRLVGPASKIKEKRRLEALTSLYMTTNDALFTAWETGKLPVTGKDLYASAILKADQLYTPDGRGVIWDAERKTAISDVYNTIHFATPLIELPIDKITETEQRDYEQFRLEYLGLWRRYFDPVGIRLALSERQVRIETYILPLIQTSQYIALRTQTGQGTIPLDINGFSPKTIFQLVSHIAKDAPERESVRSLLSVLDVPGVKKGLDWLGDWFTLRVDDSDLYAKLARRVLATREDFDTFLEGFEDMDLIFQLPVTFGVDIKNPLVSAGVLTGIRGAVNKAAPDAVTWEPLDPPYKDISIVRIQAKRDGFVDQQFNRDRKDQFLPALYYAMIDGGWYISPRKDAIERIIDEAKARKDGKQPKKETVPINTALYVAPGAGEKAREFAQLYLEWQTHSQALANTPFWYALQRAGVVSEKADEAARQQTARLFFGFVPVAGDGASYRYEPKTDEVVNQRHGSLRRPALHSTLDKSSPLLQVLEEFRTVRADLRFREDGVNTTLTIVKRPK
jgi:hypothetical protein